ncbi:MAG: hypothetical protein Ct9H90mP13_06620 [Pseudomonadota bacterium]|nr:MAG: hypothetical protein Ct9H90mP13_06620 [Pseudomonadota bacterium]
MADRASKWKILISGSKTEALPNMPEETIRLLTSMNIFGKSPNTIVEIKMDQNPPKVENLIEDLNQPFGILYANENLYVANTDSIIKFPFRGFTVSGKRRRLLIYHLAHPITIGLGISS